ncbi:MAG: hypothetical protein ACLFWI_25795 [Coleofasciculus sp.]|uniref:hypothetical protein n=1 Tax=Coleofasciculus sp. TaxID=3100458 RepID=UPI003A45EFB6
MQRLEHTAVCSTMRYIVDPPRIPHGKKAKHPLASPCKKREATSGFPVQKTRSNIWLPPF